MIDKLRAEGVTFTAHLDLHETTDTDESEFRPARMARDGEDFKAGYIPDGFYLVADAEEPQTEWHAAIIAAVKKVTHIAPPDADGAILGEPLAQEGVIGVPARRLGLCAGVTGATSESGIAPFRTTTEVYPVDKFIMQLEAQLSEKGVSVLLTDKSRDWLARKGYDKTFGARPLARVIQEHIKKPLAEELLFGRLVDGGTVNVDLSKDKLILKILGLTNKENKKKHSSSKHKDTPELT